MSKASRWRAPVPEATPTAPSLVREPKPPLDGAPLLLVQLPRSIPTPHGARDLFASPEFELALRADGTISVRQGAWHAGTSSAGCHWVFVL